MTTRIRQVADATAAFIVDVLMGNALACGLLLVSIPVFFAFGAFNSVREMIGVPSASVYAYGLGAAPEITRAYLRDAGAQLGQIMYRDNVIAWAMYWAVVIGAAAIIARLVGSAAGSIAHRYLGDRLRHDRVELARLLAPTLRSHFVVYAAALIVASLIHFTTSDTHTQPVFFYPGKGWIVTAFLALVITSAVRTLVHLRSRPNSHGMCICGYPVRGLAACPECGAASHDSRELIKQQLDRGKLTASATVRDESGTAA